MHKFKIRLKPLMKKYTALALIGAIVAGITGFVGLDATSATSSITMQGTSDMHETGLMIGHVTYEVRGMDGQIKNYFQSDNVIVDKGTDCSAQAIFDNGDSDVCTLGLNGGFGFIAIGNSTNTLPLASADDTALDVDGSGNGEVKRSGFIDATITPANSGSSLDTVVSIASTPFTFTELPSGTSITQSGLFDQGTLGGNMFSIRDIPGPTGTGLPVTSTDTLSVTWTITLT
jgi:hypothetical protein